MVLNQSINFINTNQEGILYKEYENSWFDCVVPLSGESGEGIVEAYLEFSLVPEKSVLVVCDLM